MTLRPRSVKYGGWGVPRIRTLADLGGGAVEREDAAADHGLEHTVDRLGLLPW